jgi:hypothetical protein
MTFYVGAHRRRWIVPKKYVEKVGDEGFKKGADRRGPYRFVSFTRVSSSSSTPSSSTGARRRT